MFEDIIFINKTWGDLMAYLYEMQLPEGWSINPTGNTRLEKDAFAVPVKVYGGWQTIYPIICIGKNSLMQVWIKRLDESEAVKCIVDQLNSF